MWNSFDYKLAGIPSILLQQDHCCQTLMTMEIVYVNQAEGLLNDPNDFEYKESKYVSEVNSSFASCNIFKLHEASDKCHLTLM